MALKLFEESGKITKSQINGRLISLMNDGEYDKLNPHLYVLKAYTNLIHVHPALVTEVGARISLPKFEVDILYDLLDRAQEVFENQEPLIRMDAPITVVGDLHGNFHDFLRIMFFNHYPPENRFLFLGDYVDRGQYSLEICTMLFALICRYPDCVFMIRGNHEFEIMNEPYGFRGEVLFDYPVELYERLNQVFSHLPCAALIGEKVFCIHGGLSPDLKYIEDINNITKPTKVFEGILSDIVWSDPEPDVTEYTKSKRGSGHKFGTNQINEFIQSNRLKAIIRAHQCVMQGVEKFEETELYTVFSCSNYCGSVGNDAGYINISLTGEIEPFRLDPLYDVALKRQASFVRVPKMFIPQVLIDSLKLSVPVESDGEPHKKKIRQANSVNMFQFQPFVGYIAPVPVDLTHKVVEEPPIVEITVRPRPAPPLPTRIICPSPPPNIATIFPHPNSKNKQGCKMPFEKKRNISTAVSCDGFNIRSLPPLSRVRDA